MTDRRFENFAAIDWSGEAVAKPKGLAVGLARTGSAPPALLNPVDRWSRSSILDWLLDHAAAKTNVLIGLDLSPALPFCDAGAYFPGWSKSPESAKALWGMVDEECETDHHLGSNSFLSHADAGEHFLHQHRRGDRYEGTSGRLRVCEVAQATMNLTPYSCFRLIGAAQVGKSSLTGMRVLNRLRGCIPVWPFDPIPEYGPVIVEIYTSIAARAANLRKGRSKMRTYADLDDALVALGSAPTGGSGAITDHASDAILTAAWMRANAGQRALWHPDGLTNEIAATEGWTFGVT